MSYSTKTPAQLLDEALVARHELMTGSARVAVGYDGRRVEYTRADLRQLNRYIRNLQNQVHGNGAARGRARVTYVVPQ